MKRFLIALLASSAALGAAAESPRWLRNTAISPDGKTIAFTYKGDIYSIPVGGGRATQLTTNPAYDTTPVWSPDGKTLAFASYREGSMDIYTMPATGGTPVRITTNSGAETPLAFLDNNRLLFSTTLMPSAETNRAFFPQTYVVDVTKPSPRPELFLSIPMKEASVSSNGTIVYSDRKSVENVWRKHERSSGTSDIWTYNKGKFNKLTDFDGHDLNPVWRADGKGFYFLSEEDGTLNVYESNADGTQKKQLTHFKEHPVRSLSAAKDGSLAFSWDGDIYTLAPGKKPVKLGVEIIADNYNSDRVKSYPSGGASSAAVSPTGEEIAFVLRGDVYVTDMKYNTTKRITNTPAQERNVEFSPDGKTLVYDSDRNGYWQLFLARPKSADDKRFTYATEIVEEPLYKCATSAQQPQFSPDGKKVAFLEGRDEIRVIDVKSKKVTTALPAKYNYSYSDGDISFNWSPDSKWLLATFFTEGGWNNSDIALVKADGSDIINLTESGFSTGNPKWALGGKAVTFATSKYGMKNTGSWGNQYDIILMFLDQEAYDTFNLNEEDAALKEKADKEKKEKEEKAKKEAEDKKAKKDSKKDSKKDQKEGDKKTDEKKDDVKALEFDLDNRNYRTVRLTRSGMIGDHYLNSKGTKLYFLQGATEGGSNLYETDLKTGNTKVLTRGVSGGIMTDSKGENIYLISGNGMQKIALSNGQATPVGFVAEYDRKPSLEREYIFDHMVRQVNDKFYDPKIHGVNWEKYGKHYREFLPYIDNNHDFSIMLSEILGELNASHTGSGYRAPGAPMGTATFAAFYDPNYNGDGLKIQELLPRSPLAAKDVALQPGDVILSIDGQKIEAGKDYFPLLEGKGNRKVRLEVKRVNGKTESHQVKALSSLGDMLYQRWVERNERFVDSISNGKIGYVHIEGMNTPSFQTAYDRILGKYRNCDAVIVDTRHNGGGWLHNDLANLLSGKEYVQFKPRGKYIGSEPFSQWHKPSVMLVDESNYSDAMGSPYTYQTLKIGDLVGAPVPGTMTAVWWETQIDPSLYFGIPQVTSCDMDGNPLENKQLNPEVLIYNKPEEELRGWDAQLAGAVKHLLNKTRK